MKFSRVLFMAAAFSVLAASLPAAAEDDDRFSVLTYNIWGIAGAKQRMVRAEAIGRKLAALDPDIIALEEAFEYRHREVLMKSLEDAGYEITDWRYFRRVYGSGLLFISKYPILESRFEPYRVIGGAADIEWLGGKGLAYLTLDTPWGTLEFVHTHAIARMTPVFDPQGAFIEGDPKQPDRLLHMYQIDRFTRGQRRALGRSVIAAGDFNVSPEMLEYDMLMALTGFENSFDALHPGENPSTFSVKNVFVDDDYSRIDHVFYKNHEGQLGFWVRPVESRVEFVEQFTSPKDDREINYSDHYGLLTVFEAVTEEGGVSPSPKGIEPVTCECACCEARQVDGEAVTIEQGQLAAWHEVARDVFNEAYDEQDRRNELLVPMAKVLAADESALPVTVVVPQGYRKQLERICCSAECGPADSD